MSSVVGLFDDRAQAESAVSEIRNRGIARERISIVARKDKFEGGDERQGVMDQNLTDGTVTGGTLGGMAGILGSAGALAIPGIGPILAAGPLAAGLTGAVGGGIAGGLVDLGITEDRGRFYEEEVKKGGILASVEADNQQVEDIASVMREHGAREVENH
ncbi:MAG: hypothetical protein ACOCZ3_02410 [Bacillota bacterium]